MKDLKEVKNALEKSRVKIANIDKRCLSEKTKQKLVTGMTSSINLCTELLSKAEGTKN